MTIDVLINRSGGAAKAAGDALAGQVSAAFAAAGAAANVLLLEGGDMADAVRDHAGRAQRLVVAGGDGTVSCAAGVLAGGETELAILPLGTLNHLARDAGIPADLGEAAAAAVHGQVRAIDTVQVGGHCFVNNASIGLYPRMVRTRAALQEHGLAKWVAAVPAAWAALTRQHDLRLEIDHGDGPQPLVTPQLFVGNNRYRLDAGRVGQRDALDAGRLCLLAVRHRSRPALVWFALRAALGRADPASDFVAIADGDRLVVKAAPPELAIALDGEVQRAALPLEFTVRPRSLKLVVPVS
ncbi:MAG: hypothetical protein KGN34_04235 [Sphingomonadales bacterium]|nr:hypothetical protein [Sphingomonadales bacterium]